ncbi:MAG: YicC family protein [Deltaproteobacteria bacterium]|nr:YicC family protein [Deltaproteobacteria bacterium]MBW2137167.1 YicC family protein [Deltaproteobacteria bacterium]
MKSMTAYGRGECVKDDRRFVVELKSVNNRYRDIIMRIPRSLQTMEDEMRSQVGKRIKRGRIEVFIQVERNGGEEEYTLELNAPLVKAYMGILKRLAEEFGLEQRLTAESLIQMKDVILMKPQEVDADSIRPCLHEAMGGALDSYEAMRLTEGEAIELDLQSRLCQIEEHLEEIERIASQTHEEHWKRLKEKIKRISEDIEIDENRLLQEVALLAERADITEEIVRARSHLDQFRTYMKAEDAIGRRLDFLIQEMNREVNTMSSKSSEASISMRTVEIKSELEKIREQIQNIE